MKNPELFLKKIFFQLLLGYFAIFSVTAVAEDFVATISMDLMILPGTADYLKESIEQASADGAKALVVRLDTPGGILDTTQNMVQDIFQSPIPVIIYIAPTGASAISAGVFITLAGHIAAMAPGTSIGAAHPVSGDGNDLQKDMRLKVENITTAMAKSLAERRGRNAEWAEKAVKESSSLTEKEALKQGVVDFIAEDLTALLKKIAGKKVQGPTGEILLADYSELPRRELEMSYKQRTINFFANPNVVAILWLVATTGISIELYHPGGIIPGAMGVMALILALAVGQVIPVSQGAVMLMVLGGLLIGAELYTGTIFLGVMGVISMVLGALYLIDVSAAPGMAVSTELILPLALMAGGFFFLIVRTGSKTFGISPKTGMEGIVGATGIASETISRSGRALINGEYWNVHCRKGLIEQGKPVKVVAVREGLQLEVEEIS